MEWCSEAPDSFTFQGRQKCTEEELEVLSWVGLSARNNSDNAGRSFVKFYIVGGVKVKVNFSLEQATKAQMGSRVIALIFL
jgi:hypothetical protein